MGTRLWCLKGVSMKPAVPTCAGLPLPPKVRQSDACNRLARTAHALIEFGDSQVRDYSQ